MNRIEAPPGWTPWFVGAALVLVSSFPVAAAPKVVYEKLLPDPIYSRLPPDPGQPDTTPHGPPKPALADAERLASLMRGLVNRNRLAQLDARIPKNEAWLRELQSRMRNLQAQEAQTADRFDRSVRAERAASAEAERWRDTSQARLMGEYEADKRALAEGLLRRFPKARLGDAEFEQLRSDAGRSRFAGWRLKKALRQSREARAEYAGQKDLRKTRLHTSLEGLERDYQARNGAAVYRGIRERAGPMRELDRIGMEKARTRQFIDAAEQSSQKMSEQRRQVRQQVGPRPTHGKIPGKPPRK